MRPIRNHLFAAGLPIENTKGEAEAGQEELNIRYSPALDCADYHSFAKHAIKEISWQHGRAATFLPKWDKDRAGSSSHVHQSLWKDGKPAFFDKISQIWHVQIDGPLYGWPYKIRARLYIFSCSVYQQL